MNPACRLRESPWLEFSEDGGATASLFRNGSNFHFCADVCDRWPGGRGRRPALRAVVVAAHRRQVHDQLRGGHVPAGEVACFGGRLPFYSFTGNFRVSYVKGTTVHMEITYLAHGLTAADPATIQYQYVDASGTYNSPVLPFDMANPAEDPPTACGAA